MAENNLINQIQNYYKMKEDLDIEVMPDKGYQLDEYRYVLGSEQKKMIMDEEQKRPYDVFKYYFLRSGDADSDREIMQACFDDRWEIHPDVSRLKIVCDDITYMNQFEDKEFMQKVIDSILAPIREDLELDYTDEKGILKHSTSSPAYFLGTQEKLKLIDFMKELGANSKFDWQYDYTTTPDELDEHIDARWVLGMYDKSHDCIELICVYPKDGVVDSNWFLMLEFPIDYLHEFILDTDVESLISTFRNEIREDLELDVMHGSNIPMLAQKIADQMGECIVDNNIIYQTMQDFEIYKDDDETLEVPYGIFAIFEIVPNKIICWNSSADTCEDVDNIGKKPLEYFTSSKITECESLREFIEYLDSWYGRDWFSAGSDTEEFIDDYGPMLYEDLDLDVVDLSGNQDAYNLVRYGGLSAHLNDMGKEDVAAFLGMEDEEYDSMKEDEWYIMKNSAELDSWYEESDDDEFPFALVIGDRFYDALSDSAGDDILNDHKEEFFLE